MATEPGSSVEAQRGRPAWWRAFVPLAAMAVGVVYLVAAAIKGADPALFVEQIRGYKILPDAIAPLAAPAMVVLEAMLGFALLLRVWPRPTILAAGTLMLLFIGATAWAWAHGNASSCGCFGRLASRGPGAVILEDALFVSLLAFAYVFGGGGAGRRRRIAFWVLLPLALALPWIGPALPVDGWVTSLRPGASLKDLAADDLKAPLDEGRVLIALVGPDCRACDEAIEPLNAVAESAGELRVTAIFAGDRKAKFAWRNEHVPGFPVAHAPEKALRQYYRKLPAFMLLESGVVRRIWWDRPPRLEEIGS